MNLDSAALESVEGDWEAEKWSPIQHIFRRQLALSQY